MAQLHDRYVIMIMMMIMMMIIMMMMTTTTYKMLYLECCSLWTRNMDCREKRREGRKCIRNMELERNVKNKMDG